LNNRNFTPDKHNSTLAIISLVSGITGWTLVPFFGAIIAVITGHMARREIKQSLGSQGGDALAVIGLILGYLNLVASCVLPLLIIGGVIGIGGLVSLCAALADPASFDASALR
jgi:hypothetical protein